MDVQYTASDKNKDKTKILYLWNIIIEINLK